MYSAELIGMRSAYAAYVCIFEHDGMSVVNVILFGLVVFVSIISVLVCYIWEALILVSSKRIRWCHSPSKLIVDNIFLMDIYLYSNIK